jgi:hypothetical protein
MSNYLKLRDDMTLGIKVSQPPSQYVWKNNPLSSASIIADNQAGFKSLPIPNQYQPVGSDKPYAFSYQGCCDVILPKSEEYKNLKQVIFSP